MVRLERNDIASPSVNPTTQKRERRLNAVPLSDPVDRPKGKGGKTDCSVAPSMRPAGTKGKPATHTHNTTKFRIPAHLCSRMGLIGSQEAGRTLRAFKRRVYGTLRSMATAATPPREVSVMQFQRGREWERVWNNLHNIQMPGGARSAWFMLIRDLIPINTRLHRNRLVVT